MKPDSFATGILSIDLDALSRNYRRLRELAAPSECGAVVKANAYGLGIGPVAARLFRDGCRRFFVATLAEGLELRALLPAARIYVFEGAVEGAAEKLRGASLTPVLNSLEQVRRWAGRGSEAVLHLDTGMARLGLSEPDVVQLSGRLDGLRIEYLMTHLACADEPSHPLNAEQLERFDALCRRLPAAKTSIANSAGVFLGPAHRGDLARPGIGLYGGNPFIDRDNPMEPVVTLSARILQLRDVAAPGTVGYGATHRMAPPVRLATLGVGYADGYRRTLGNRADAVVDGVRVPVVGRVSMDLTSVDVSALDPARVQPGRLVELIGPGVTVDEIAAHADTANYEILTGLGARLQRAYREA